MPVRKEGTEGYSMGDQGGDLPLLVLKMIMESCRFQGIERVPIALKRSGLVKAETDPARVFARLPSTSEDTRKMTMEYLSLKYKKKLSHLW